ncbi:histidinol dehydrogenase [bacterium]|nr:histidinol dehydrogenase [bacterium]
MKVLNLRKDKKEIARIINRPPFEESALKAVSDIVKRVREEGDSALIDFVHRYDSPNVRSLGVSEEEVERAYDKAPKRFLSAVRRAKRNIENFHRACLKNIRETFLRFPNGTKLASLIRPIERVGIYIPGGKAIYPSTLLMTAIPAQVAGVGEIIICSPAQRDGEIHPLILATAKELGLRKIYRVGGAQAISAMAFGTETIPKVDKIVGPGGAMVASAKREVFGYVSIESIAGPSEVLILADETANPRFIASDLLAQAEHDPLAWSVLVTTSPTLVEEVEKEMDAILPTLGRIEIIKSSLDQRGYSVIADSLNEAIEFVNDFAPEHLEIMAQNAEEFLPKIKHAGAIFLGDFSPTAIGDYIAGPSHTLPTGRTARFFSPLSVEDFLKRISLISYTYPQLRRDARSAARIAKEEGLSAHALSILLRLEELQNEKS